MKVKIAIISLSFILVISIIASFSMYSSIKDIDTIKTSMYEYFVEYYNNKFLLEMESEGYNLSNIVLKDSTLKDEFCLNFNKPTLCYYFSEINCGSCVEEASKVIEQYRNHSRLNIIYLGKYQRERDLIIYKRINNIKSKVYNVDSINIPAKELDSPLVFVIDNDSMKYIFSPDKHDTISLSRYLSIIDSKYMDKK